MDIKKLLEYQKKDFEIVKLEKNLMNSEDKRIFTNMINIVRDAQKRSAELEKDAEELVLSFEAIKNSYVETEKTLKTMQLKQSETSDIEELEVLKNKLTTIATNLNILEKKICSKAEQVKKVLDEFDSTKKRYISAKDKHKLHKSKYEEIETKLKPEIEIIEKELRLLEKDIDPNLLAKYKIRRGDKIFPIFVSLSGNSCGGCMMELPSGVLSKLKNQGFLECENCRRIIYFN